MKIVLSQKEMSEVTKYPQYTMDGKLNNYLRDRNIDIKDAWDKGKWLEDGSMFVITLEE